MGRWLAAALIALLIGAPAARAGRTLDTTAPVVLRADEVVYDQAQGVVIARGKVEIAQGERILLADKVTYDENTDKVIASGDVTLLEPSGEVVFADYIELKDEMRNGLVRDIRILFADDSRFAANGAIRTGGTRTELSKAVFSPCRLSPFNPKRAPLWQIKAIKVVHDTTTKDIEYTDAFFEVFGMPIAYMPYFRHADPTVKRRSGFLTPRYSTGSQLGLRVEVPYFFNLKPYRDFTFAPIFTTKEGVVLSGEYRERTRNGVYQIAASVTRPRRRGDNGELIGGRETRGHVKGFGRFDLGPIWRWGFDVARATDDTYLRRYRFSSEDTLTTRLFLEGLNGRSYAAINGYAFQGLKEDDDPGQTPLVMPIAEVKLVGRPGRFGDYFTADINAMNLTRSEGPDSRRLSLKGGWHLPYLGPLGDIYTLTASLRGDLYWVDNGTGLGTGKGDELTGRIVPQLALDWRFPLIRTQGGLREVIEPVASFAISPYGGNPSDIPNEDSQDFEFDDTNLLSLNRFTGLDRIEGGPRLSYGLRMGVYGEDGGRATAFIGQSYRVKADSTFAPNSGLDENLSDFVGRVRISPNEYFDLAYRFRLDSDNFSSKRSEVDFAAGPSWLRFNLGFLSLDIPPEGLAQEVGKREELRVSARGRIDRYWSVSAFNRRDITNDRTIDMGVGVLYEDECLLFSTQLTRRFNEDRDVQPETLLQFTVRLKHLG